MNLIRRQVLATAAAAFAAPRLKAAPPEAAPWKFCVFSKHLHFLQGEELARAAVEVGFDGVDLTVRGKGHVEPARAAQDLPPLVKILRAHKLEVPMVTAGIVDAETPHAESVIRTLADLGIPFYRWGGFRYDYSRPLAPQLEVLKPRVAALAALNKKYGLCAIYHTHSGIGQVGASIWDLFLILKDQDPAHVAINYDTAHATIEGGFGGWMNSLRMAGPYLRGIALKDFIWQRDEKTGWRPRWAPIGEGMVRFPQFFQILAQARFQGPLQIHYEYPMGGAEGGNVKISIPKSEVLAMMKKDLEILRTHARQAQTPAA